MAVDKGNWFSNQNEVSTKIDGISDDGATWVGAVTGNVAGNVVGNVTGDVTGTVLRTVSSPAGAGTVDADWSVASGIGTLAAEKSGSALIIPISGLSVGDTITAFKVNGQIESAGGTVSLTASLYEVIPLAAGSSTTDIGAITTLSGITADTLVQSSKTLAAAKTVITGYSYFVYITGTTAASTDIEITSIEVTVT